MKIGQRRFVISGTCNNCGKCCISESPDATTKANGECLNLEWRDGKSFCRIHSRKPFGCFLGPAGNHPDYCFPSSCGYKRVEIT